MIKVEINVTMLPATIRQVHVLTLKRVQQPLKAEQNAEYSRQSETASVKKLQSNAVTKEQERQKRKTTG